MKKWMIWLIAILLVMLAAYWAYLKISQPAPQPQEETSNGNGETAISQEGDETIPSDTGEMVDISVSGTSYRFTPATITVLAGVRVRLTYTNTNTIFHDFVIPSLNVSTALVAPGGSQTIEFTAPSQAGSFEFICSVPGHKESGMKGTLIVE